MRTMEDGMEAEVTAGLDEIDAPDPDQNPDDSSIYRHRSLESRHSQPHQDQSVQDLPWKETLQVQFSITAYLILFSILGVLARLGLTALTTFAGAPVAVPVVWANTAGSLVMGFMREDRTLFRRQWKSWSLKRSRHDSSAECIGLGELCYDEADAKDKFIAARAKMHSFVGLTVGFCGTFTSFADIIRDFFFAIINDLDTTPISTHESSNKLRGRNRGYSVLAGISVLWIETALSISALSLGAHMAIAARPLANIIPSIGLSGFVDIVVYFVGYGAWIGAVCLAIWPPMEAWRGQVLFAVVFAPCGAILRYHLSRLLNRKIASFPLGTFIANVLGTTVLGMVLDLQHTRSGQVLIPCQVLQGVADGFCGGLTTVSTWVLELDGLAKKHAYLYAATSLSVAAACLIVTVGPLRWTPGLW